MRVRIRVAIWLKSEACATIDLTLFDLYCPVVTHGSIGWRGRGGWRRLDMTRGVGHVRGE